MIRDNYSNVLDILKNRIVTEDDKIKVQNLFFLPSGYQLIHINRILFTIDIQPVQIEILHCLKNLFPKQMLHICEAIENILSERIQTIARQIEFNDRRR